MSIAHTELNENAETTVVDSLAEPEVIGDMLPLYNFRPVNSSFSVNDFLKRRTLMYTYTFSGTLSTTTQSYATDFIALPSILQKMKYMSLLRGTFVLDFVMNTNTYACGQIIVASHMGPWSSMGVTTSATNIIYNCTTKDNVILDAGSANTATIEIPMRIQYPYVNVSATGPDGNLVKQMFTIATLVPLLSTQDGTNCSSTILVYCSMKDTDLAVPIINGSNAIYTMSSRKESKSTEKGWFSYPVSIVAAAGKALKDIPVIGPFAYATGMFLSATADFAKFFGFSRPRSLAQINYTHDEDYSSYVGAIHSKTLTLDPLQEIPLDPSFIGDSGDNLSYENIVTRKGLVTIFPWGNTYASGTTIFTIPVTPSWIPLNDTTNYTVSMPPVTYVSQLFKFWTGSLTYHFEIPANKYCRGKLRFAWTSQEFVTTPTFSEITQNGLSVVLDLTTSSKVSITVPWANSNPYLPVLMPGGTLTQYASACNGVIYVFVEEQLIVPATTFSLNVITYITAHKDIDFQIPDQDKIQRFYRVPYVTGFGGTPVPLAQTLVNPTGPNTAPGFQSPNCDLNYYVFTMESNLNNPMLSTSHTILPDDNRYLPAMMNMGEKFLTLRTYLKRFYEYHYLVADAPGYWNFFPFIPAELFPTVSGSNVVMPPIVNTPLRYIINMYYGIRGTIRYRIDPGLSSTTTGFPFRTHIKRRFSYPFTYSSGYQLTAPSLELTSAQGQATYATNGGESIIIDVPYQGNSNYLNTSITPYSSEVYGFGVYDYSMGNYTVYSSIGEDFNPVIWNGTPIVSMFYIS